MDSALQGARSSGAETELVQLYDLSFSGCISCFSCKKLSRKEDGVCAVQDDLTEVLDRVKEADALIIGTPIYYGSESAATRAFLERLCFPYLKSEIFDKEAKYKRHAEVFPEDCRQAFDLGVRMAAGKISEPDPIPR